VPLTYLFCHFQARQSYYEALLSVAQSILDDAETYMALKGHVQRVRIHKETDPLPQLRLSGGPEGKSPKLSKGIKEAQSAIAVADEAGNSVLELLLDDEDSAKDGDNYEEAISLYRKSFDACAALLDLDKHSFYSSWFKEFYKRNYDALMIKSMYDNVLEDIDKVRYW
jgi:hypothetical protein